MTEEFKVVEEIVYYNPEWRKSWKENNGIWPHAVEANRKLVEIFERKIQAKLAEIWGEENL